MNQSPPQLASLGMTRADAVHVLTRFVPGYVPPPNVSPAAVRKRTYFPKTGATEKVLRLLAKGPITSVQICNRLGLAISTVSSILTRHEKLGRVKRVGKVPVKGKRPLILYTVV